LIKNLGKENRKKIEYAVINNGNLIYFIKDG